MKNLTSILASIILPFVSGCAFLFNPPFVSGTPPNPKLDPILPLEKKASYGEMNTRGKIIADSLKKNFPEGVIVYLKKNNYQNERYITLKISETTLNITLYKCPNIGIKEKLREFYLFDKDSEKVFYNINASEVLDQNYLNKVEFNDVPPYGIRFSKDTKKQEDYVKTQTKGSEEIKFIKGKLMQGKEIKEDNIENLTDYLETSNSILSDILIKLTSV